MSTTTLPVIRLQSCPKGYTRDLDKTISPQETYERVQARMQAAGLDILAEVRRVDVGRLGIPVYLSVCGRDARGIMPTRKQMGKGSSPEQARASALMELMERFAFFSFWQRLPHMVSATWAEAEERFGKDLLPIEEIRRSVDDSLSPEQAREAMSTLRWNFFPATHLADGRTVWLPLDWFKLLGEFNGTSAGNSPEESLLQGLSELVERHVCCRIDRERLTTPSIDPHEVDDPTLRDLLAAFEREGIHIEKTKVGDRYVLENMLENGYNIGGEQSGHIIFLDENTTGDGLLSALHLLQVMTETKKKLSELASIMEVLPQALVNAKVPNHKKEHFEEYAEIAEAIAEVEAKFAGEGRVLIRPSGTEPLVRVMIEGKDQQLIESEAQKLAELISSIML